MTLTAEVLSEDTSKLLRGDWLQLRKTGLGSSDAAPALNQSPWRSQFEVYAEKRGLIPDRGDNWRFRIGRDAEPLVLGWWAEMFDQDVSRLRRHTMLRSTEYPFMLANADADSDELDAVIEVKTDSEFDQKRWDAGVPDQYVIQGLHLMLVYGRPRCIFPVAFGWNPPVQFEVSLTDVEPKTIDALITVEADLWQRVLDGNAPDPDGSESAMMTVREMYLASDPEKTIELPDTVKNLLIERDLHVAEAARATKEAEAIKQRLMIMLGDAEVGTYNDERLVTWKANKNGVRSMLFPRRSF